MTDTGTDKAARYVDQLNNARITGAFSEINELGRKVTKHAPRRKCLVITATSEASLALLEGTRAGTLTDTKGTLARILEDLKQTINTTDNQQEDAFGACVCLAHAQMELQQWDEVTQTLESACWPSTTTQGRTDLVLVYSILKGKFVLGRAQQELGRPSDAEATFESAVPIIENIRKTVAAYPQIHHWAVRTLGELCASGTTSGIPVSLESMGKLLIRYRLWSDVGKDLVRLSSGVRPSSHIWRSYYGLLGKILRSNIVYSASEAHPLITTDTDISRAALARKRTRLFAEMESVINGYEQALMRENSFPKATESNEVFESFVDQVMRDWRVITSSEWTNDDLGEVGKVGYTRHTLELLYRAASRTFHSTSILRNLMILHATLAEFDLAVKALDSYIDIISKGKARAEKTGNHEIGFDNDDDVLQAAALATNFLCVYGEYDQAEKAQRLGQKITSWLGQKVPTSSSNISKAPDSVLASENVEASRLCTSAALAAAYRALGQSQAHWARNTQDATERSTLQEEALLNLRRSAQLAEEMSLETAYLLAFVHAERRSTVEAIDIIKNAIAQDKKITRVSVTQNAAEIEFDTLRRRLPLMHLLVLLLSASNQFDTAIIICESTLDDICDAARNCDYARGQDPDATDGNLHHSDLPVFLGEHLTAAEKECLLQLKMSEMELLVLTENVIYASHKRQDILRLYDHLFGRPRPKSVVLPSNGVTANTFPRSRAGTIKSFRTSIFGRPKTPRKSLDGTTFEEPPPVPTHPLLQRDAEKQHDEQESEPGPAPPVEVKVINADGEQVDPQSRHKSHRISLSIRRGRLRHSHDVSKLQREQASPTLRSASDPPPVPLLKAAASPTDKSSTSPHRNRVSSRGSRFTNRTEDSPVINGLSADGKSEKDDLVSTKNPELRMAETSKSTDRTPAPFFDQHRQLSHRVSLLVQIWLFISDLYTKEDLYDEARHAVNEAETYVEMLKAEQATIESSARAWCNRGWGLGSSISRLMADVWAERARIFTLLSSPHDAIQAYEHSISYDTDHPPTLIHLSSILLDIYDQNIPAEPPTDRDLLAQPTTSSSMVLDSFGIRKKDGEAQGIVQSDETDSSTERSPKGPSSAKLNRIAARDRAYMLLMSVVKHGEGWDSAEAWFDLSRAHESMGQQDKAEEALWWVVQLEDARPIRPWRVAGFMQ